MLLIFLSGSFNTIYAQEWIPIRIEIRESEQGQSDNGNSEQNTSEDVNSAEDEDEVRPSPGPSANPSQSPAPAPIAAQRTPEPTSTPVPISSPDPTPIPNTGGPVNVNPEPVQKAALVPIVQQIQDQFSDRAEPTPSPSNQATRTLTPGEIFTPIIPRGVIERIIPAGLYKDDGLNPIDGLALLLFGLGSLLTGSALIRPDIFLPALTKRNFFSGEKTLLDRQLFRRNQTIIHHNG